jgi:formylglycine-generating enzyme required for sulfatase activity
MNIQRATLRSLLILIIATPYWMLWIAQAHAAEPDKSSKSVSTFHDCKGCPEMLVIRAGRFDMGSPATEVDRERNEGPVHRVKVAAFALGRTEITRGQFATFVKNTGYKAADQCWTLEGSTFRVRSGRYWRDLGFLQDDKHPAACISWNDASAYAKWLSGKTGKHYRLPTEAEWEYAARGNTVTSRYWGDDPSEACAYSNGADKSSAALVGASSWSAHDCVDGYPNTAPVASFKPNRFGVYDMLGNVWEWTADSYHDSYNGAPSTGKVWQDKNAKYVLRGGSWNSGPERVRAAKRGRDKASTRFSNIGFRVARTLP